MRFQDYLKFVNKSGLEILKAAKVGETVSFGTIVFTLTKFDINLINQAIFKTKEGV